MGTGVTVGGPWQGIHLEEWLSHISPWPRPWVAREMPLLRSPERDGETLEQLEALGIYFGQPVDSHLEARTLDGDR